MDESGIELVVQLKEKHEVVKECDDEKKYMIDEDWFLLETGTRRGYKNICPGCLYFLNKITPSADECRLKFLCEGVILLKCIFWWC